MNKNDNKQSEKQELKEEKFTLNSGIIKYLLVIITYAMVFMFLTWYFQPVKSEEKHNIIALDSKQKIETVVGVNVANRIEVKGEDLLEVTGDESKYQLKWNKNHRNIYLVPKAEVGEVIELSLMLASGKVQDLRLTIGDVLAKTIILESQEREVENFYDEQEKAEITEMLQAMRKEQNNNNKYWINEQKVKLLWSKDKQINRAKEYRYGKLVGEIIEIENRGKGQLIVSDADIKSIITDLKLVNISKRILQPKEKTQIFVVSKKE